MSVYVCSDIHGRYDRYAQLLKDINFSDDDKMYILGDVVDRNGIGGIDILQDIMYRPNIQLLLGNHELFFLEALELMRRYEDENDYIWDINCWLNRNGGMVTYNNYKILNGESKDKIYEYIKNLSVIEVIDVNGEKYHLSHSSTIAQRLQSVYKISDLCKMDLKSVVWNSPYRSGNTYTPKSWYSEDLTYIVGHVPTTKVIGSYDISHDDNIIDIDCGCANAAGRLGCLRLDDMQEFYVR